MLQISTAWDRSYRSNLRFGLKDQISTYYSIDSRLWSEPDIPNGYGTKCQPYLDPFGDNFDGCADTERKGVLHNLFDSVRKFVSLRTESLN